MRIFLICIEDFEFQKVFRGLNSLSSINFACACVLRSVNKFCNWCVPHYPPPPSPLPSLLRWGYETLRTKSINSETYPQNDHRSFNMFCYLIFFSLTDRQTDQFICVLNAHWSKESLEEINAVYLKLQRRKSHSWLKYWPACRIIE